MKSENIDKLALALSKAQGQIEGAVRDSDNPFFKSKYADLASVWDACKKPLTENGLAVVQTTDLLNDKPVLRTMLIHSSGQWIEGIYQIISAKQDAQGMVAALTYARRAALAAIVGVCPIDDDGETAAGRGGPIAQPKPHVPAMPEQLRPQAQANPLLKESKPVVSRFQKITAPQAKRFLAIAAKSGITKEITDAYLRTVIGSISAYDIPPDKYEELCKWAEGTNNPPSKQAIEDMTIPDFMKEDIPWGGDK